MINQAMEVLLLLLLLLPSASAAADEVNIKHPGCLSECGGVAIPYPFGIGVDCSMPGFELTCNKSNIDGHDKPFVGNTVKIISISLISGQAPVEIISISLTSGQARVYQRVSSACYNSAGNTDFNDWWQNYTDSPYRHSNINKFTTVGCNTLAYMIGDAYVSGCVSKCPSKESIAGVSSCRGKGCCQTPIPEGLNYYRVRFDEEYNTTDIYNFSRCGYGFLVEEGAFTFDPKYITTDALLESNEAWMPVVLDWAIGKDTCEAAQAKSSSSYACQDEHSDCFNSITGLGYICNCSSGYEGNLYLVHGCRDINECDHPNEYPCYGTCSNFEGSFSCESKSKKFKRWIELLIGLLCTFVLATFANHMYERVKLMRAKQKCFQQNGGLLLQEQINAHQGVKFKIFTIKEIERATDNFDASRVLGEGGHGLVYRGSLADNREVAIKRSRINDQRQKKEFAKEMYIGSLINHRNVVNILGCCLEVEVPLLVYEFVPKGDLFNYIHIQNDPIPLDYRLKVVGESAAALAYLHSDASPPILHGDIKSSNILLDEGYTPKVSDFGTSLLDKDELSTHAQGTWGYIDPEYVHTCLLTDKSDVYSFAVVFLEVFTRKKVVLSDRSGAKTGLVSVFFSSARENRFRELLDSEIRHELENELVEEMVEMLSRCLSPSGESRPAMKEVAAWIERLRKYTRPSTTKPLLAHDLRLYEGNDLNSGESSSFWIADGTNYTSTESRMVVNIDSGR